MTKLEKIEADIKSLSAEDIKSLGNWFAEFQADQWDAQIERDAKAGKLDKLAAEALKELDAGQARPLPGCN